MLLGIAIENVNNAASPKMFDIFIHGYRDKSSLPNHNFNTISGSIPAESDAGGSPVGVIAVGAVNQSQCLSPANCPGALELFSGQGPTQATPQATAATKPDIIGVDMVCITGAGGFGNGPASNCPPSQPTTYTPAIFGGTSAAAPHVAAIAALILQSSPCLLQANIVGTPAHARTNIRNALTANAVLLPGILEPVPNNEGGYGLVDALTSTMSMVPSVMTAPSEPTVSATGPNGATVELSGSGSDPNNCPLLGIQWTGGCGTNTAPGLHATVTCPIGVSAVRIGVSNNNVTFTPMAQVPVSTVVVTDFVVSAAPTNATGPPGSPSVYTITVASTAQGAFTNPVTLACSSGLPAKASCSFSPVTVTPTTMSAATSILTVVTSGQGQTSQGTQRFGPNTLTLLIGLVLIIAILELNDLTKGNKKRAVFRLGVCTSLLFLCSALSGCNSPATTQTPVGTYQVTITGTSNQLQRHTSITVNVQ